MPIQTVPFVPIFILGGFFLIAPGMIVTLFSNSDPLGFAVVMATAIAALIRPTASWMLFAVLCSMRTVPFIVAALTAVAMKIGLASRVGDRQSLIGAGIDARYRDDGYVVREIRNLAAQLAAIRDGCPVPARDGPPLPPIGLEPSVG